LRLLLPRRGTGREARIDVAHLTRIGKEVAEGEQRSEDADEPREDEQRDFGREKSAHGVPVFVRGWDRVLYELDHQDLMGPTVTPAFVSPQLAARDSGAHGPSARPLTERPCAG
jgi:hypothetical protein